MEIRGARSILGAEQSGHIAGVGFDLYVRLVGEAVAAFRQAGGAGARAGGGGGGRAGVPAPLRGRAGGAGARRAGGAGPLLEVRVELPVDAHVPHEYVPGERLRL